jgi:hypothetical protein
MGGCCCFFVEQNPTPLAILLEFLREGVIRIEDLDAKVLMIQAEYLGIEIVR